MYTENNVIVDSNLPLMLSVNGKKDYVNRALLHEIKYDKLFIEFINETVARKRRRNKPTYERVYRTLVYHLNNFCEKYDAVLYTNSIGEVFLDEFITYLEDCNCKASYINHLLALIKSMLAKAAKFNYAVDPSYDDVTVEHEDTYAVFLTLNQITRIYYYIGLTRKQERIRDLFIVGCLTALRYSDYSTLTPANFKDGFIHKVQKKTGREVIIPEHDYIKEIYKKYNGNLSFGLSLQYFNRAIKEICKQIGLTEDISFSYRRGGKTVTETLPLYKMIGSHTARRSAATNMVLSGRFSMYQVMSYTGHATEKSLKRYLRISIQDIANQMSVDNFFKK